MNDTRGTEFAIGARRVGPDQPPLVVAEIGINHEGDPAKAHQLVDAAADAGLECVKFQTHVVEDEMIPNDVVPGNATEPIWDMMQRCALSAQDEREIKDHATERGLLFFSTPFSRPRPTGSPSSTCPRSRSAPGSATTTRWCATSRRWASR